MLLICSPWNLNGGDRRNSSMCRVLMYLGEPALLNDFLYKTDSSLIKQTYGSQYSASYNLAGFGIVAWEKKRKEPFVYRTKHIPFYDINLKQLSLNINSNCFLAHVRGTILTDNAIISERNVHPFMYEGYRIALAHNGNLYNYESMKIDFLKHIKPEIAINIKGSTDTELFYALFMSQFPNPYKNYSIVDTVNCLIKAIMVLKKIRKESNTNTASELNLFITNGEWVIATRYVLDFGKYNIDTFSPGKLSYQSLWFTFGKKYGFYENEYKMDIGKNKNSLLITSEPLTKDTTTWFEVPESSIIAACIKNGKLIMYKKFIEE